MRFTEHRQKQINDILLARQRVSVQDLVDQFEVSAESIRRDLRELEKRGVARRVYGGAVLSPEIGDREFGERARVNSREKARIGMANGEEKYLPVRDRGPQRKFVRDFVDAGWHAGELLMPLMLVVILVSLVQNTAIVYYSFVALWVFILFVVGDILGTGVYALTGDVAAEVSGAAWVPFLVAFLIATVTAFSYLELVTKYPQAAGAALYAHKAFGVQFVTFLVAFVVMCSGITSASTASRFFADNFNIAFHLDWGKLAIAFVALLFMAAIASVNFRGVSESVKLNVVLTIIEITGLVLVILVALVWAAVALLRRRRRKKSAHA